MYKPSVELAEYFSRICFKGEPKADLDTLRRIHRLQLQHIPYENIDVQLGEPLGLAIEPIFEKLVRQGRGGWCYELNGLLQWVLEQIGFDVMRVSSGVDRKTRGDTVMGSHLILSIQLDGDTWLADVGFADGIREPVRLHEGEFTQAGLRYSLQRVTDGYWRFNHHQFGNVSGFDFIHRPADETELERLCGHLQSSPESPFVQTLVCTKFDSDAVQILLGRTRRTLTGNGLETRVLETQEELHAELESVYGLSVNIGSLWQQIVESHNSPA